MRTNTEQINHLGNVFLGIIATEMQELQLDNISGHPDHLCWRTSNLENYDLMKELLSKMGSLLIESSVNGRRIATYKLDKPFLFRGHQINLLEVTAPKPGVDYDDGFEHIEFVIDQPFSEIQMAYPNLKFESSNEKEINNELSLSLPTRKKIKFHHLSLERVIEIEKAQITDIIFDLDGTLVDSNEIIHEVNRASFEFGLGRTVTLDEAKKNYHSSFKELCEAFHVKEASLQQHILDEWESLIFGQSFQLFEGVEQLLSELSKSFKLHLWTARSQESTFLILNQHNIRKHFESISCSSKSLCKPDPQSLNLDWTRFSKRNAILVGDSVNDLRGAKNLNVISIFASWCKYAHLGQIESKLVFPDLQFKRLEDFSIWIQNYCTAD